MATDIENLSPRVKRTRKRRSDTKYKEKYAKDLRSGIRYKKGYSVVELCRKWRISYQTYLNWVARYPEFADAHELGKVDYASFWHEKHRGITLGEIDGQGGQAEKYMNNVDLINWNEPKVKEEDDKEVRSITINIIPAPPRPELTQQPQESPVIINGELIENNVIKLNAKKETDGE